jgi:hypothetical protein
MAPYSNAFLQGSLSHPSNTLLYHNSTQSTSTIEKTNIIGEGNDNDENNSSQESTKIMQEERISNEEVSVSSNEEVSIGNKCILCNYHVKGNMKNLCAHIQHKHPYCDLSQLKKMKMKDWVKCDKCHKNYKGIRGIAKHSN